MGKRRRRITGSLIRRNVGEAVGFLFANSLFLVLGAIAGLIWANVDHETYARLTHGLVGPDGHLHGFGHAFHFAVNDVGMALFFAMAAKEVWEAMLPGGDLSSLRTAATPLIATAGGMTGPALIYVAGCLVLGQHVLMRGWAIPMATDIAFSYMVARLIFGPRHPAIPFLLLLAIADDAGGLIVLAIFYPQAELRLGVFFTLVTAAVLLGLFMHRKLRLQSFWWYMIPGVISWVGFWKGGIHPALGLVPVIPTLPHAKTDLGIFAVAEQGRTDTLNEFEHWWARPVELILGLFGLANAGVALSSMGEGTLLVGLGLLIGKPLGITIFVLLIAKRMLKLQLPRGMELKDLLVVGVTAGIGFTVALFMSTAAFPMGPEFASELSSVKMGALLSFAAAPLALAAGKLMRIRKVHIALEEAGAGEGEGEDGGEDGEPLSTAGAAGPAVGAPTDAATGGAAPSRTDPAS